MSVHERFHCLLTVVGLIRAFHSGWTAATVLAVCVYACGVDGRLNLEDGNDWGGQVTGRAMWYAAARGKMRSSGFDGQTRGGPSSEPWSRLHFQLEFDFLLTFCAFSLFFPVSAGTTRLRESCCNDRHRRTRTAIRSRGVPMTEFSSVKTRDAGAAFCDPGGSCCFPLLKQRATRCRTAIVQNCSARRKSSLWRCRVGPGGLCSHMVLCLRKGCVIRACTVWYRWRMRYTPHALRTILT